MSVTSRNSSWAFSNASHVRVTFSYNGVTIDIGAEFVIRLVSKFSLRVKLLRAEERRRFAAATSSMIVHTDEYFGIVMFSVDVQTTADMTRITQAPASGRIWNRYIIFVFV